MYHVSSVVSNMYCKFLMECIKKVHLLFLDKESLEKKYRKCYTCNKMLSLYISYIVPVMKSVKKYHIDHLYQFNLHT